MSVLLNSFGIELHGLCFVFLLADLRVKNVGLVLDLSRIWQLFVDDRHGTRQLADLPIHQQGSIELEGCLPELLRILRNESWRFYPVK